MLCKCGCGGIVKPGNVYINGHNWRGKVNWRKGTGKPLPPAKLCECNCGNYANPGKRYIYGHCLIGRPRTEETKQKLRKPKSEEGRLNIKEAANRPETRKRKSEAGILAQNRPEVKENNSKIHIGWYKNPGNKEKHKRACNTSQAWSNSSARSLRNWQNPEFVRKQMKARNVQQNKLEKKLESILNCLYPANYKFVGNGEVIIAGKCPDFINVNGQKKIIELFGDYWHRGQNPQDRIDIFKPYGYDTLVIWERELKNIERVKFRIHRFHRREHATHISPTIGPGLIEPKRVRVQY